MRNRESIEVLHEKVEKLKSRKIEKIEKIEIIEGMLELWNKSMCMKNRGKSIEALHKQL